MTEPGQPGVRLAPTACAVCGTFGDADELYPATYDLAAFNERVFSARRIPDSIHYRMVRCRRCGLVRSDPSADQASLSHLYERSSFDYAAEVPNLRRTYGRYLAKAKRHARGRSLLEIGCGSGFMLEEALSQGYEHVRGIEPSHKAIAAAASSIRGQIVPGIMEPGLFEAGEFDTVCMFQVFDHLPDPGGLLDQVRVVLGARGVVLCFNHNIRSLSARILGERSPIVDIEHCYLYSLDTMRRLLEKHGYEVLEAGATTNTLSFSHLLRLFPGPKEIKRGLLGAAERTRIGRLALRVPLGNLYAIGRRT